MVVEMGARFVVIDFLGTLSENIQCNWRVYQGASGRSFRPQSDPMYE